MRNIAYFLSTLLLITSCSQKDSTETISFSDFLDYGSYSVGFRTMFATDLSREDVPYSDWGGRLYPTDGHGEGRSLPIHIWYPAVKSSKPLMFGDYLELITRQSNQQVASIDDSLAKHIYINQVNDLKGDSSFTEEHLSKLLFLQTKASLNAVPIEGKFPLVIFPNGTSPANQSVMCEFLASHGYVVAGLPLKGQYAHVLDASVKGLEVAVDDLQFALQQLLTLSYVDGNQIALMANAIESSFCAGLAARNEKIKALVSLEGGFLSQFEQNILDGSNFYEEQSITLPILAIYSPHPSISPDYIFHLKYSERYFAHFPEMSEFHFLNFGVFEEYVPGMICETKGNTKIGFKAASELTLAFFNAQLKSETKSLDQFYSNDGSPNYDGVIDTLYRLEGFAAPPHLAVLKNLFITRGMSSVDSIYQSHHAQGDKQPFSLGFYDDFRAWLAWKKDPDFIHRQRLYQMAVESFPNSALSNYYMAHYLNKTGSIESPKKYYLHAMELLDTDNDIDQKLKITLREAIQDALK